MQATRKLQLMSETTRHSMALIVMIAALARILVPGEAQSQAYPMRPIQVIVPFAGGSASDVVTRILLERTSKGLGQPFVVENRPGAGGNTGTQAATRATPDGYTLVATGSGPTAVNVTLYADLGYDPARDLEPISLVAQFPINVVASTKLPVSSLSELIAYAKARPGQLNYGSVGIGSSQHLGGAYFEQVAGVKLTHVPYRNIAQYGPDLIAGSVPLGFQWLPNVLAPLNSGGARALAVATTTRLAALPDVPTTAEAGLPQYLASGWFVLLAPRGTPKPVIARLNEEVTAALKDPAVRARYTEQGAEPLIFTPDELGKFMADETLRFRDVIVKAGIEPIK
jgi:tripartite-type tricarboxylate transporter receptor subunit TctC